jgi:hypothetical protein
VYALVGGVCGEELGMIWEEKLGRIMSKGAQAGKWGPAWVGWASTYRRGAHM